MMEMIICIFRKHFYFFLKNVSVIPRSSVCLVSKSGNLSQIVNLWWAAYCVWDLGVRGCFPIFQKLDFWFNRKKLIRIDPKNMHKLPKLVELRALKVVFRKTRFLMIVSANLGDWFGPRLSPIFRPILSLAPWAFWGFSRKSIDEILFPLLSTKL